MKIPPLMAVILLCALCPNLRGQEGDLSAQVIPPRYRSRSQAPLTARVKLTSSWSGVPKGRLHVTLLGDGLTELSHYQGPVWALPSGEHSYRLTLPGAVSSPFQSPEKVFARLSFVREDGKIFLLGEHLLSVLGGTSRTVMVGRSVPQGQEARYGALAGDLRLERFDPQKGEGRPRQRSEPPFGVSGDFAPRRAPSSRARAAADRPITTIQCEDSKVGLYQLMNGRLAW